MTHYNLVRKFIPVPQAMKIPDAEAAMDKNWKKLETIPGLAVGEVNSKKVVILEAQRDKKEGPLCYVDGHLSSQIAEFFPQISEVQRKSRAPR